MQQPAFSASDFKPVHEYKGGNMYVRFEALKNGECPGYSHRVLVLDHNRVVIRKDWLSNQFVPSARHAAYYASKVVEEDAGNDE